MPITILDLANHRLGRNAESGQDFADAGLAIIGGCLSCGASIAAYNAYPSRAGYWCCKHCIHDFGWESVEEADAAIFGDEFYSKVVHIETEEGDDYDAKVVRCDEDRGVLVRPVVPHGRTAVGESADRSARWVLPNEVDFDGAA